MDNYYINVDRFRSLVERTFGLCLSDPTDQIQNVVRRRILATGCRDFASYEALVTGQSSTELRAIAELLTVGETYFFRNGDHFRALVEHALPDRLRAAGSRRPIRVLSAGCSSGEEPYTVAILLREFFPELDSTNVAIVGIDVNPAAIAKARQALYTPWSLRETLAPIRERYFRQVGNDHALIDDIRAMVSFEERNLFENDAGFWARASFDIVFCRNVVIYFAPEKLTDAIARLTEILVSRGFLFLGHSESLRGMTDDLDVLQTHNTFYYQKRDASAMGTPAGSWIKAIDRASRRVEQLTSRPPPPLGNNGAVPYTPSPQHESPSRRSEPLAATAASTDLAIELYRQERFADALNLLRSLPAAANEPRVQLLIAAILTNQGELQQAETICRDVLGHDEWNAGAHYLMAIARERSGDLDGAKRHDEMAAYMDATFAMPRLHLGMLARHAGDLFTARRELSLAVTLLAREDLARIVLFGGGFSREALMQLCRAELHAAGGKS
jgi:chemotaxis protein methyltransferase CheR